MFEHGRPGERVEMIIIGVFTLWALITGCIAAANASKWKKAGNVPLFDGGFTFTNSSFNGAAGASGFLAFVGFATFVFGVFWLAFGRRMAALQSSLAWLVMSCVFFVLWLIGAAALAGEQPGLSGCNGTYYDIPCSLGNASLAFGWIGWIFTFGMVVTGGIYYWKRNDWRSRSQGGLAGPSSKSMQQQHGATSGFNSISRPMHSNDAYPPTSTA